MSPSHRPVSTPIFRVKDASSSSSFYQRLGFEVIPYDESYSIVTDQGQELVHLQAVPPGVEYPGPAVAFLNVDDVDGYHRKWAAAGASVTEVEDREWGMREFSVEDPSGNVMRVGTNL